jgi:hypothetical protein
MEFYLKNLSMPRKFNLSKFFDAMEFYFKKSFVAMETLW